MTERKRLIEVFADNYDTLAKQAIGMTGNKEDALDVLQDVALSLIYRESQADEIVAPFAYFRTCIRNASINNKQKNRNMVISAKRHYAIQSQMDF